ncbi:MAG: alpha/beta fold hydrolase [Chitinophagales bacterium]
MPLLTSTFKTPFYLPGGDIQSIIPAISRRVTGVKYQRERISTPDNDFIDIDWLHNTSLKIVLLLHGLEASADSPYMKGMSKALHAAGFSVAAMNLRGCSGEVNNQVRSYHSGSTDDVATVIDHLLQNKHCKNLMLVGFSLGGNLTLKYLGERNSLDERISKAVAISVPCDLEACALHLDNRIPFIYRNRFLRTLKHKAILRVGRLPFSLSLRQIKKLDTFIEFDDYYTSQLYGFKDAKDYYKKSSSKQFIPSITIPTLILTALNDPFFTAACFPFEECTNSPNVFLETPGDGGHVGFCTDFFSGSYHSEKRAIEFLMGDDKNSLA